MRKMKRLAKRAAAFSMATLLACSGFLDNLAIGSRTIIGNVSGMVNAEAAVVNGTVNADKFSWDNATVYFMLTDRFRNGNTSNDHSYGRNLDKNGNVINVSDDRATFHGGDFAGVTQSIKEGYFNDLGVNALWISAPYEQIHGYIVGGDGSPSFAHYSYHGYYVLDYTQTDANFGTAEEFRELVDTAHEHGIRVVLDIVLNHAGYNSLYDMNEYGFGVVKSGWDSYYFSMANVNNKDYHSYIDYDADAALWGKWWGPDWIRAGLPGYTEGSGNEITQSLAGLPDFKTESTKTVGIPTFLETKWKKEGRYDQEVNELKSYLNSKGLPMTVNNTICYWLSCWVREYGVDGFRCDTAKHVEKSEWRVLHDMCTEALKEWKSKNPDKKLDDLEFWMTGEHWDHGVGYDDYYSVSKFDSMINFDTTGGGVLALGTVASKYESYAAAINTRDDFNVLSYMSSHDTTLARGDMKYLGSALLMLPGGVQIFYGDELARPKVGPDDSYGAGHCLRSDMNWDNYDEDVLAHWQKVGAFRNNHIAVGAGTHTTVSATSGVGFVRTYSKNGVTDRIAAVIGASANAEVTIDVSGAWDDGSVVTNYYDNSSATVTGGKVTFNSGANGAILIADPDGKPLVTVTGTSKFKGTQTVKINIKEADYAIVSVDGAKKFKAYDGDTFTIGATAYEGDTVAVSYKATNEKGTINGKATFYKAYANEEFKEEEEEEEKVKGKVRVKMSDGSAPYLYAWESETKKFAGDWPGTKLTQKDSEGYYYLELDTTGTYNVIFNNGGAKTDDITGLSGETTFTVQAGFGSYEMIGGTVDKPSVDNTITIRVKPYSSSQQVYLHVWSGSSGITGAWPGKHLTEKDENGNYIFTVDGYESVNCIINNGSNQNQSDNITGITGEALITINSDSYGDYKVDKVEKAESKFALMKKEARGIKNMTSSDYTSATWQKLYAYVSSADALVAQGEENADADAVTRMYNDIVAAKKALVLAAPKVKVANSGSKVVKGMAACEATVSVTINGSKYTALADEVTGVWTVNASSSLTSSSTISATASRDGLSSGTGSYSLSSGNINEPLEENGGNDDPIDPLEPLAVTLKVNNSTAAQTVTKGTTVKLTPGATGGDGSYTYKYAIQNVSTGKWTVLKDYSTATSYSYKMDYTGEKVFLIKVKDSTGKEVSSNKVTVNVVNPTTPLAGTLKIDGSTANKSVTKGTTVKLVASATGGSGSYTYKIAVRNDSTGAWTTVKDFSTTNTRSCAMNNVGKRTFAVTVKDSNGTTVATNRITITVTNPTSELKGTLKIDGSTANKTVTKGTTVKLVASATGGSGSYTYKIAVRNDSTGAWTTVKDFSTTNTRSCAMNNVGKRTFAVTVKDSTGKTVATNRITITVTGSAELTAKLTANGGTGNIVAFVGDSVTLKATAAGGSGSYTYKFAVYNVDTKSWYTLKDFSSTATYTTKLSSAGTKQFVVTVKDSSGKTVSSERITVNALG